MQLVEDDLQQSFSQSACLRLYTPVDSLPRKTQESLRRMYTKELLKWQPGLFPADLHTFTEKPQPRSLAQKRSQKLKTKTKRALLKVQELKCGPVPAYTITQAHAGGTQHVKFSLTEFEQQVVQPQAIDESESEPVVKKAKAPSEEYYREEEELMGDPYSQEYSHSEEPPSD